MFDDGIELGFDSIELSVTDLRGDVSLLNPVPTIGGRDVVGIYRIGVVNLLDRTIQLFGLTVVDPTEEDSITLLENEVGHCVTTHTRSALKMS